MAPDTRTLDGILAVVREYPSMTARQISDVTPLEPGQVMRILRELERRNLVRPWKRPGTRAQLWNAVDA